MKIVVSVLEGQRQVWKEQLYFSYSLYHCLKPKGLICCMYYLFGYLDNSIPDSSSDPNSQHAHSKVYIVKIMFIYLGIEKKYVGMRIRQKLFQV